MHAIWRFVKFQTGATAIEYAVLLGADAIGLYHGPDAGRSIDRNELYEFFRFDE